jgi:hypothetical protein
MPLDMTKQVRVNNAPWAKVAPPKDYKGVSLNLWGMLHSAGFTKPVQVRKMIAHAIMASGWMQRNAWNHNYWKMKTGRNWPGNWFAKKSPENINGKLVLKGSTWRHYDNPKGGIDGYWNFINKLIRYRESLAILTNESIPEDEFWRQLGLDGWYNGPFKAGDFQSVANRVKREIENATVEEKNAAKAIDINAPRFVKPVEFVNIEADPTKEPEQAKEPESTGSPVGDTFEFPWLAVGAGVVLAVLLIWAIK